jgi:hypothetical protein
LVNLYPLLESNHLIPGIEPETYFVDQSPGLILHSQNAIILVEQNILEIANIVADALQLLQRYNHLNREENGQSLSTSPMVVDFLLRERLPVVLLKTAFEIVGYSIEFEQLGCQLTAGTIHLRPQLGKDVPAHLETHVAQYCFHLVLAQISEGQSLLIIFYPVFPNLTNEVQAVHIAVRYEVEQAVLVVKQIVNVMNKAVELHLFYNQ